MRRATWGWVVGLAAVACLGWLPFISRSLSPDEGGFLIVGGQWSPGSSLYGDYWVDRPPGLIAIFGLADSLGGLVPLRLIGAVAVVVTVVLSGVLGRLAAPGNNRAVLLPAATAAILTATPLFGGSVVNGEVLGLPFLVGGIAALVAAHAARDATRAVVWGTLAGISGALAVLVKQNLVDVFVLAVALLLTRRRSARATAGVVIGGAVTIGLAFVLASARGTDPGALWNALVTFRFEAAEVLTGSNESTAGRFGALLLALLFSGTPLLAVALGRAARRELATPGPAVPDLRRPAYAVLTVEMVVVLLGGSYWLHYLMGLVPGVVLLAVAAAQRPTPLGRLAVGAYAFAGLSALGVIGWLGLHPIDRPEEPVIAYLDRHARAGDSAVVAFGGANILGERDLACPYEYLWSLPVRVRDPDLHDLEAVLAGPGPPTWVIVSYGSLQVWDLDFTEARDYLDAGYTETADLGRFTVYRIDDDG